MNSIAVVYLARAAEGLEAMGRFIASYKSIPSGCKHDLVIVKKGAFDAGQKQGLDNFVRDIPHRIIELDDTGFDITAYLTAARQLSHDRLCFLNTFTEVLADGWLAKLNSSLAENVGIVGATGSYESLYSSIELLSKAVWFTEIGQIPYDGQVARHYRWFLLQHAPNWLAHKIPQSKRIRVRMFVSRMIRGTQSLEERWASYWPVVRDEVLKLINDVPRFPNPHIRSNGFMVRRSQLLGFDWPTIVTKDDACRFESGFDSLTTRLKKQGYSALIVGRDGAYDIPKWPSSDTFRLDSQSNLLLADNQTRNFACYSEQERRIHVVISWGSSGRIDLNALPLFGLAESFSVQVKEN